MNISQFENLKPEGIDDAVDRIRDLMRQITATGVGFVLENEDAATCIYHVFTGRTTHNIVATRKIPYKLGDQETSFYYEILAIDKYNIGHVLSLRFLYDLNDLEPMCSIVTGLTWRFHDDEGDLRFCDPQDYVMVYISALDIVGNGKGLYRLGFPSTECDLVYDVPFPTLLVNGEIAEGNDISNLVRELLHIEYASNQFGAVSSEIDSVRSAFMDAIEKADQMASNAIIVFGIHENNNIPVEDVLNYMEFPAAFRPQLRSAVSRLVEFDPYKKRRQK